MKKIISTKDAPAAIGPYSQGVRAGNFLFVAGQLPIDPVTGAIAGSDIESQTRQALENVKAVVNAAGMDLQDIVKANVYMKDLGSFAAMNSIYAAYFDVDCPARAAVEVSRLPKDAFIEIEAIAYKEPDFDA